MTTAIDAEYLLCSDLPMIVDRAGKGWLDPLWIKDLIRHRVYLSHLTIACPHFREEPAAGMMCADDVPELAGTHFVLLPGSRSFKQALRNLPRTIALLRGAVRQAKIVHVTMAGWPIPLGWIATPLARWRRKKLVAVVESAFWRIAPSEKPSWKRRLRARLTERINRWCVRNCNLAIFTQEAYRRQMLPQREAATRRVSLPRSAVIPASWIDAENILSIAEAAQIAANRKTHSSLRVLFAARLIPEKGVAVLLAAARQLAEQGVVAEIDMIGEGPERERCRLAAAEMTGGVRLHLLNPVPYGEPFFHLLRRYDAIVIPNLSDEQPRIVFDAFSQGLPVVGSDTDGLRECVRHGETGWLFPPGDSDALAALLRKAADERDFLETMGRTALEQARSLTHEEMHRRRWELLTAVG